LRPGPDRPPGALFGIAASNRSGSLATIRNILFACLLTLPSAILLANLGYLPIA
jgi:phosphate/sulfate permease